MRAGVLQLSRWGLLDQVVAAGTPAGAPDHASTTPACEPVHVSIKPSAGVAALYAPRRHLLDRILVDAAAAAGADVLHGVTRDRAAPATAPAGSAGSGRPAPGGDLRLRAAVTVGADGIRSVVAREAGAPVDRAGRAAGAVLYRLRRRPAGRRLRVGVRRVGGRRADPDQRRPDRASSSRPPRSGCARCESRATDDRLPDAGRPGRARSSWTGWPPPTARRRTHGWGGVAGFVRRSWGPGWALVGDAGYFKDPITAHGMTDALRDAELLADADPGGPGRRDARGGGAVPLPGDPGPAVAPDVRGRRKRSRRTTGTSSAPSGCCARSARR